MKIMTCMALAIVLAVSAGCSKKAPEAKPIDVVKLCAHLVPLYPDEAERKSFAQTCEATYRRDLPACHNASEVAACFMGIKTWEERHTCANLCKRNAGSSK